MAQINEQMIRAVYGEMLKYKPSLAKQMVTDDDEDDGDIDYRLQGDVIIKNFPWPIGVELRRLFSGSMRQFDRARLDQIFKTIERAMQFISFSMICQLWQEKLKKNLILTDNLKKDFESRFTVLGMGDFAWIIRAIGNYFEVQNIEWFMKEMSATFDKKFYAALDFWVPERNEIGHYQINLTQEEIEKRCVEYEEKLTFILQKIAFFANYKLVSVREIKVQKSKIKEAKFRHVIDLLNSSDSDFKAKELDDIHFAESNAVMIMKTMKSIDEHLNLSPLVIDTKSEVLDNKDKFSIKKDIFMYTKFRGEQLFYVGTEVTEKCDLRALSNYKNLLDEFRDLMKVFH